MDTDAANIPESTDTAGAPELPQADATYPDLHPAIEPAPKPAIPPMERRVRVASRKAFPAGGQGRHGRQHIKTLQHKIIKTSFEFLRWKRVWCIQRDLRKGYTWAEIMASQKCSKPTVQRSAKLVIPPEFLAEFNDTNAATAPSMPGRTLARDSTNCTLNQIEFVEDEQHLNCTLFPMQRVILKAFYGIPLDNVKIVPAFKELTGQDLTEQGILDRLVAEKKCTWKGLQEYRELVLVVGMKGGKSFLAGVIACIEEFSLYKKDDFRAFYGLPKGKQVLILNVAANEEQAKKTIFAEVDQLIKNGPYYQRRPEPASNATAFHFEESNVIIQSGHSNGNALVGPLSKAVLMDELDRFSEKKDGKSSGMHMYSSISRNVAPFKLDGKIVCISSPMSVSGPIIRLFNMSKEEPTMLGFWLATWELNPNLPLKSPIMQADLRKCPEDFWRDFGAQPSHVLEKYYRDRSKIDAVFARGEKMGLKNPITEEGTFEEWFRGNPNFNYHIHMDPSIKNDHFGLGMAHREGAYVKVDLAHEFIAEQGEIDYASVGEFLNLLADRFPTLTSSTYDVYLAIQINQALRARGIDASFFRIDKAQHDVMKIETVYNDRLVCYNVPVLRRELRDLDLVGGKKVDHPDQNEEGGRGSKDVADAVAGAVCACVAEGEFEESPAAGACMDAPAERQESGGMFGNKGGAMFGGEEHETVGMFGPKGGGLIW